MAVFNGTNQTYTAKGLREDLSDRIYNIDPVETPLVSMAAKPRCRQTLVEWQTQALTTAVTTNQQIEGDDLTTYAAITRSVRVGNYTQIARKDFSISDTEEVVNKAGRGSEVRYQAMLKGSELKRDMSAHLFGAVAGAAGGASTARAAASLNAWIKSNTDTGTSGGDPAYTSGVPGAARTDGTPRAFTETILKAVCQSVWTSGGKLRLLFVGPVNKAKVSAFSGIATTTWNMNAPRKQASIVGAADVYVNDFGVLDVMPHRFMRERDAWLIDPDFVELPHLRPFRVQKMAKTGDAEKRMINVEYTVKVGQEAACGLAADLTTT